MSNFTLLWGRILDSSVWMEDKDTRLVWITMLAMKDKDGVVSSSEVGLAHRARVELPACHCALVKFLNPDPQSSSKVDEGRRIREVPGGWQIINHESYRFSTEAKREFWREAKRRQRAKKGELKSIPLTGEKAFVKAVENGDEALADRIAAGEHRGVFDEGSSSEASG